MRKNKIKFEHKSVLLKESINFLKIKNNGIYIDATFGSGGHTKAILESNKTTKVLAIDRDPDVKYKGQILRKKFKERFKLIIDKISNIENILKKEKIPKINGIFFDLGVSTTQLKDASRGFSFQNNGPLDMRMGKKGMMAKDFINNEKEEAISKIIFNFGEERNARKIAKKIVDYRQSKSIETTEELSNIIKTIKKNNNKINPATKTFQAIRIYINKELEELEKGLLITKKILFKGGRLVIISFHSLEDRIIKRFLYRNSGKIYNNSRYLPQSEPNIIPGPIFKILTKKVVRPTPFEIKSNSYSRSAKLRAAEKL